MLSRLNALSSFAFAIVLGALVSMPTGRALGLCPFCSGVTQPLSEELDSSDVVAYATIVDGSESETDAVFRIEMVLKGKNLLSKGDELRIPYFGAAKPETHFLLMGIDPPELLWSFPREVSKAARKYLVDVINLPSEPVERLRFFLGYLEHEDPMLAKDAYEEFGSSPYEDVKKLKEDFDHDQLIKWITNKDVQQNRRRLYFVMLGICGSKDDAKLLEKLMKSEDPVDQMGLDSMLGCYITLTGNEGLDTVDELFVKNKQREYGDIFAALQALRFHGSEGNVVEKERLLKSFRLFLDRPEYADLVIRDLARFEDWSQIDRLVSLFKNAEDDTNWVRVPVINFLRSCPLPKAKELLKELKEIDPDAFKRAQIYYPVQGAGAWIAPSSEHRVTYAYDVRHQAEQPKPSDRLAMAAAARAATIQHSPPAARAVKAAPNRILAASVLGSVAATLWITMWLLLSGAGMPNVLTRMLAGL
ncbi:MAG: hypothetical protein Aurels2KO_21020 [Aureliella sp.]